MAEEAEGRRYRYWLHRELAADGVGGLVFVLLNPSTADALEDDPTIRRCVGFGTRWGYRELTVVNLFALRATSPAVLRQHGADAIGRCNDDALRWARSEPRTRTVVAGWGNHGTHLGRDVAAMDIVRPTMALRTTKLGCPAHPLYLPSASELQPQPIFTIVTGDSGRIRGFSGAWPSQVVDFAGRRFRRGRCSAIK